MFKDGYIPLWYQEQFAAHLAILDQQELLKLEKEHNKTKRTDTYPP